MRNFISGIKKRISGKKGFTLTELLAATLIMALSTGLVAGIMNLAAAQFFKTTQIAEAQTLCSTIATYVESELTYAKVDEDGKYFYSDIHNFGPDAYFVIASSGEDPSPAEVTFKSNPAVCGIIGETSPLFKESALSNAKFYDIAGAKAYGIGAGNTYNLACKIQLSLDNKNNTISDNSNKPQYITNTARCTIDVVEKTTNKVLASRAIVITVRQKCKIVSSGT